MPRHHAVPSEKDLDNLIIRLLKMKAPKAAWVNNCLNIIVSVCMLLNITLGQFQSQESLVLKCKLKIPGGICHVGRDGIFQYKYAESSTGSSPKSKRF